MSDCSQNSIEPLLLKVAAGDESAFGQLFKAHYSQLSGYIMRITESELLAEEIVQDVFLKIWINRQSLTELKSFQAYLMVVARNHAFNCMKQIARERVKKNEWVNAILNNVSFYADEPAMVDKAQLIDEAVELLPAQQKRVYHLSRVEGIRQVEIARELNISHRTVKKHMVLAIRFLKNHVRAHLAFLAFFLSGVL